MCVCVCRCVDADYFLVYLVTKSRFLFKLKSSLTPALNIIIKRAKKPSQELAPAEATHLHTHTHEERRHTHTLAQLPAVIINRHWNSIHKFERHSHSDFQIPVRVRVSDGVGVAILILILMLLFGNGNQHTHQTHTHSYSHSHSLRASCAAGPSHVGCHKNVKGK